MKKLSFMQSTIYAEMEAYIHSNRELPTLTKLAQNRGLTVPTIKQHVDYLKHKGFMNYFNFCPNCGMQLKKF